jgi:hypothetical protein
MSLGRGKHSRLFVPAISPPLSLPSSSFCFPCLLSFHTLSVHSTCLRFIRKLAPDARSSLCIHIRSGVQEIYPICNVIGPSSPKGYLRQRTSASRESFFLWTLSVSDISRLDQSCARVCLLFLFGCIRSSPPLAGIGAIPAVAILCAITTALCHRNLPSFSHLHHFHTPYRHLSR